MALILTWRRTLTYQEKKEYAKYQYKDGNLRIFSNCLFSQTSQQQLKSESEFHDFLENPLRNALGIKWLKGTLPILFHLFRSKTISEGPLKYPGSENYHTVHCSLNDNTKTNVLRRNTFCCSAGKWSWKGRRWWRNGRKDQLTLSTGQSGSVCEVTVWFILHNNRILNSTLNEIGR